MPRTRGPSACRYRQPASMVVLADEHSRRSRPMNGMDRDCRSGTRPVIPSTGTDRHSISVRRLLFAARWSNPTRKLSGSVSLSSGWQRNLSRYGVAPTCRTSGECTVPSAEQGQIAGFSLHGAVAPFERPECLPRVVLQTNLQTNCTAREMLSRYEGASRPVVAQTRSNA